jgi:hypothetical protein
MELTLPPVRHETIEKQDPVHEWRVVSYANGREIVITFGQEQAPALALGTDVW